MEPATDIDLLQAILPSTISLIVTGLISIAIGIYLEKFRTRVSHLKYDIQYQPLATASQNEYWGEIQVFHNNRQTNHLNFVTITIENGNNVDFENLNMDAWVDKESQILAHNGYYDDSKATIFLENGYYTYFNEVLRRNEADLNQKQKDPEHQTPMQLQNEIDAVMRNKKFYLPVLNRHTKVIFNLLVENFKGEVPEVNVNILHKSLKMTERMDEDTELGLTFIYSLAIGLMIFIGVVYYLIKLYPVSFAPILITAINGLLCTVLGFGVLKLFRFIKNMI